MASKEELEKRIKDGMEGDFMPLFHPGTLIAGDLRAAHALEYIAYQLGKIRQHLEKSG